MNRGNETGSNSDRPDKAVMQAPATHIDAPVLKVNVNEHCGPQVSPTSKPRVLGRAQVKLCGQAAPRIWESIAGQSDRLIVKESVESASD